MKGAAQIKKQSTLKQKFRELIEGLRSKTVFQNKPHLSFEEVMRPIEAQLDKQMTDVLPTTHNETAEVAEEKEEKKVEEVEISASNPSEMLLQMKSFSKCKKQCEIEIEDAQSQPQVQQNHIINKGEKQLSPDRAMKCPSNQGRVGQIKHQNISINRSLNKKLIEERQSVRYSKKDHKSQYKHKCLPVQTRRVAVSIKELDDLQVIKYWNRHYKLTEESTQTQIYRYFEMMMEELAIDLDDPIIHRFKNCLYFGEKQAKTVYEGMICYFSGKLYYGQFLKGLKHGQGVEINFLQNVKYAGIFNGGSKNGYFFVQKQRENYEGTLQYGLYQGHGKLMTEDSVYTGSFQNGKKHGYGQEYHPKTGLKVQGYFNEGQYQNFSEIGKRKNKERGQEELPSKLQRTVLKKSDSYDIKVDLTSRLIKKQKSQVMSAREQRSQSDKNQSEPIKEVEFQQDSKSLFDMLQKRKTTSKYDFYVDKIAKKLPKIHIQALPQRSSHVIPETHHNPQNVIINKKYINEADENEIVLSKFQRNRQKPIRSSSPKENEETPIYRKKHVNRPC